MACRTIFCFVPYRFYDLTVYLLSTFLKKSLRKVSI